MDQKAFLAITAMLNSFPQQAATDSETLLKTYSAVLRDISSQAVTETAQHFICGEVNGQSRTFAPSVAEVQAARKVIAAFELPENKGKGAIKVDGRMVELLHAEIARQTVALADAIAGLSA